MARSPRWYWSPRRCGPSRQTCTPRCCRIQPRFPRRIRPAAKCAPPPRPTQGRAGPPRDPRRPAPGPTASHPAGQANPARSPRTRRRSRRPRGSRSLDRSGKHGGVRWRWQGRARRRERTLARRRRGARGKDEEEDQQGTTSGNGVGIHRSILAARVYFAHGGSPGMATRVCRSSWRREPSTAGPLPTGLVRPRWSGRPRPSGSSVRPAPRR